MREIVSVNQKMRFFGVMCGEMNLIIATISYIVKWDVDEEDLNVVQANGGGSRNEITFCAVVEGVSSRGRWRNETKMVMERSLISGQL